MNRSSIMVPELVLKRIDAECSSLDSIDSITKASVINAVSCHLNRCKGNETRLEQRFFNS
jgi:hypothetical protein